VNGHVSVPVAEAGPAIVLNPAFKISSTEKWQHMAVGVPFQKNCPARNGPGFSPNIGLSTVNGGWKEG